jgi:hypothetical protein
VSASTKPKATTAAPGPRNSLKAARTNRLDEPGQGAALLVHRSPLDGAGQVPRHDRFGADGGSPEHVTSSGQL